MTKIAFIFPGVGSQYVGMVRGIYDQYPIFRRTLEEASDVTGKDFPRLCFGDAKMPEISKLENAQLLLFTLGTGFFRVYMETIGIKPGYCLGHSLGEYTALCNAGVIPFSDGLEIVRRRGEIISEVAETVDGTMMWVINLDRQIVEEVCGEVSGSNPDEGVSVHISAYDCPTQSSISGHKDVIMTAAKMLQDKGAIVYPLKMSGPFHSPLMQEAADRMTEFLAGYTGKFKNPIYPVVANHNAQLYKGKQSVAENLSTQLISPIRWLDSIVYIEEQGVKVAVEMGPKDVLKFLMKKNSNVIRAFTMDKQDDVEALTDTLLVPQSEYIQVIARCLGAAVSTKNRNSSMPPAAYAKQVVTPYNRVASIYRDLQAQEKPPTKSHVKEALNMVKTILAAKRVPQQTRQISINKILNGRITI